MRNHLRRVFAVILVGLFSTSNAMPCSRVLWSAGDGQVFVGRTQDWTEKINSAFRVYPRGIERTGAVAENPLKWTSKYGSITFNQSGQAFPSDGMNEKGLFVAILLLEKTKWPAPDCRASISAGQWIQYQLDNSSNVQEVIANDQHIQIMGGAIGKPVAIHTTISKSAILTLALLISPVLQRRGSRPAPVKPGRELRSRGLRS